MRNLTEKEQIDRNGRRCLAAAKLLHEGERGEREKGTPNLRAERRECGWRRRLMAGGRRETIERSLRQIRAASNCRCRILDRLEEDQSSFKPLNFSVLQFNPHNLFLSQNCELFGFSNSGRSRVVSGWSHFLCLFLYQNFVYNIMAENAITATVFGLIYEV